uniref:Uncharacterized protein n=1 Tax=Anguilla anguilla TaxID=7936 RepID=A0A0E9RAA4_ANGAN
MFSQERSNPMFVISLPKGFSMYACAVVGVKALCTLNR